MHVLAAIHVAPPTYARGADAHASLVASSSSAPTIARGTSSRSTTVLDRAASSPSSGDGDGAPRALAVLPSLPSLAAPLAGIITFGHRCDSIHGDDVRSTASARGPPLHA